MGQIIIDIPVEQNFHYEIENAEEYRKLLKILDGFIARRKIFDR